MRILSLNTWYGERESDLRSFLASYLDSTDIFCLQETDSTTIEQIIIDLFDNSNFFITQSNKSIDDESRYSSHTVVKKPLVISECHTILANNDATTGHAFAAIIKSDDRDPLAVVSVHGAPFPGHKLDNEGRLRQTDQIIDWFKKSNLPGIICGDFNLLPETESIKKFSTAGFQDLIKNYSITTTRNHHAWAMYPDNKQLFADYTFVSPQIRITNFAVPNVEVSDHLPMIIDII